MPHCFPEGNPSAIGLGVEEETGLEASQVCSDDVSNVETLVKGEE